MKTSEATLEFSSVERFAPRIENVPRSCVRELLSSGKKLISFGGGVPHDSCFPIDAMRRAFDRVLSEHGPSAFRYGQSEGEVALREFIAREWLPRFGVDAQTSEVLIVNGSQQALDLIGKVFVDRHAPLIVERPTYLAALQAFSLFGPRYREVAMDAHGALPDRLDDHLNEEPCGFFYAIPSFQNPSGCCYSAARRAAIAEILNRRGALLVEDDPYSQLYYGEPPAVLPVCALGVERSLLLGTFSKMVAPGFRLGWIWTRSAETMRHLVTAKQAADLCTGRFQQLFLLETIRQLDLEDHLARTRVLYKLKRDTMDLLLKKYASGLLAWKKPGGGMFFWAALTRPGLTARELLVSCVKSGVAFAEGSSFHATGGGEEFLRLNFTQATGEEMERGLRIIAEQIAAAKP
jgi:2-aminoadipate transaminase